MTATAITLPITRTNEGSTIEAGPTELRATVRPVWKTGLAAGLGASVATAGTAGVAHAAGVSLAVGGQAIPLVGFAQMTFVAAMLGTLLAAVFARRATRPQRTFLVTTIALTLLSFVPDVLADAHASTRLTLALTHIVAAAMVIPALASRLSEPTS
jgi:cyanophycinase-like exopeptidase